MFTRTRAFSLAIAILLMLTLLPGVPTAATSPSSLLVKEEWPQMDRVAGEPAAGAGTSASAEKVEAVGQSVALAPTADSNAGWEEVGDGSATGNGVSNNAGHSADPSMAIAPDGTPYLAWTDVSSGSWQIYVRRWNGSKWEALDGSATGGGISNSSGSATQPSLVIDPDSTPYVAWGDVTAGTKIYMRRWSGSSWVELGGSATGGGISNSTDADAPSLVIAPNSKNPYVAWTDVPGICPEIYLRYWNGSSWAQLGGSASGGGISDSGCMDTVSNPSLAIDAGDDPYVAWEDVRSGQYQIYLRRWDGSNWGELGGSATGGGLSGQAGSAGPSLALDKDGNPCVAWVASDGADNEIYLRCWNGSSWTALEGSASGGGISNNNGNSTYPSLSLAPDGTLYVAWQDSSGGDTEIYVRRWDGSNWVEIGTGSASGGGISNNTGNSEDPSLAIAPNSAPYVAWEDTSGGGIQQIYVRRRGAGAAISGRVRVGFDDHPVPDAQVTLRRGGTTVLTDTTDTSGCYCFTKAITGTNLSVRVTLQDSAGVTPTFRIRYGLNNNLNTPPVVYAETAPFTLTTSSPFAKEINFGITPTLTTALGIPKDRLNDLAAIYYHTWQSAQLAARHAITLDHDLPVDVYAYAIQYGGSVTDTCYWMGPYTEGANAGVDPHIVLGENDSDHSNPDRPGNREWHEFGHHVMGDAFGNLMPENPPGDKNHDGYKNSMTVDSWTEGWAEFWSLMVADEISGTAKPWFYKYNTNAGVVVENLEANFKAWEDEEFAVAGALWDLYDSVSITDTAIVTPTGAGAITLTDNIDLTTDRILNILVRDYGAAFNPGKGNGYPFDVLAVYSATISNTVGYGYTITDVNNIFISHGLYYDANSNKNWENVERVGQTTNGARPNRRNKPPRKGSYVAYTAIEVDTGAPLIVSDFLVSVVYEPPFEDYSYTYTTHTEQDVPGLLYSIAPPSEYAATVIITPLLTSYRSLAPLTYTTGFYWAQMDLLPTVSFIEHTFVLERVHHPVYLPLVLRNYTPPPTFFDDFSDPNSGWPVEDWPEVATDYNNGNYRIQIKQDNLFVWVSPSELTYPDGTFEVEAWRSTGGNSTYGIVFGLDGSAGEFYAFIIQPYLQQYALRRRDSGGWVTLIPYTDSSYINFDEAHNQLKVTREGSQITLYVNDHYLDSYSDSTYIGGTRRVGVYAGSGSTSPVWLRYDDFTVWGGEYGMTSTSVNGGGDFGVVVAPPD